VDVLLDLLGVLDDVEEDVLLGVLDEVEDDVLLDVELRVDVEDDVDVVEHGQGTAINKACSISVYVLSTGTISNASNSSQSGMYPSPNTKASSNISSAHSSSYGKAGSNSFVKVLPAVVTN
jgi:hypothetical protein